MADESDSLREFLAGERLDDVALFLSSEYGTDKLSQLGEPVEGGVVIVVPGEKGRGAFSAATGMDTMEFARTAMSRDGEIDPLLNGGDCPEQSGEHAVRFVFAFAEAENEGVGGLYAEGDVIHAYAHCACGGSYSHKWVVGERPPVA